MKKIILILFTIGMTAMSSTVMAAMSNSKVRTETRFLTDKMAYELKLTTAQYDDAYEINYDFINSIRYLIDDAVRGYEWALDDYYGFLDVRNDDLRWVLNDSQYRRFMKQDYFYRPIYMSGGGWNFRVYITYTNRNHYYYPKPHHYRSYCGGHYRTHNNNASYYSGRYNHSSYSGRHSVMDNRDSNRHSDFGSVSIRPNSSTRPSSATRPSNSSRPSKPNRPSTTTDRDHSSSTRRGNSSTHSRSSADSRRETKSNNSESTRTNSTRRSSDR